MPSSLFPMIRLALDINGTKFGFFILDSIFFGSYEYSPGPGVASYERSGLRGARLMNCVVIFDSVNE